MVETLSAGDVVNEQGTGRISVVAACNATEGLLAGLEKGQRAAIVLVRNTAGGVLTHRVPYLQFDLLAVDGNKPRAKFNTNSEIMHWLKSLVGELEEHA